MMTAAKNRSGVSLLETLAYVALLGLILSLIYSVFYQFSRTLSAADTTLLKERSTFDAVRNIQNDIRWSREVLERFGPFKASEGHLILVMQRDNAMEEQVIVYRRAVSKQRLMKHIMTAAPTPEILASTSIGHGIESFDFIVERHGTKTIRVSIGMKEGPFGMFRRQPLTFHASLRNGYDNV